MGKRSKKEVVRKGHSSVKASKKMSVAVAVILKPVVHIFLIALIGFLVYSNTFRVPFLFDDESSIYKNIAVKDAGYLAKTSVSGMFTSPRLIGHLTFVMNHAAHGFDVTGYHIVNLVIHISCALLVYLFVVLIFRTPYFAGCFQGSVDPSFHVQGFVALFASLLFVSHPVQTQAITYIVQRYASLAALFYLLSLVMYIRFRLLESSNALYVFYAVSAFSAVLAMKTKEISFTLPVMITLCEFMFFRGAIKKRMYYLIPLILTMMIIPLSLIGAHDSSPITATTFDELTKGASLNIISPWDYLNTQFRVIVTYIRLLFLPVNQNLDYDYPIYRTFFTAPVYLSFLFLLVIVGGGVYLAYRSFRVSGVKGSLYRLTGFGIFWFFVTLSVESSIIPIADVIYEHRLYLPSVGVFIAVMAGVVWLKDRFGDNKTQLNNAIWVVMMIIVTGLSVTTYARNTVWRDEVTLWEDVAGKSPNKARPHNNLGELFYKRGRLDDAQREYLTALSIKPYYVDARINLGALYEKRGLFNEALEEYKIAARINPQSSEAYYNLGGIYTKLGYEEDAINQYQHAIKLKPNYPEAHYNLGNAYYKRLLYDKAMEEYQMAFKIKPDYFEPLNNLGNVYIDQNRFDDAVNAFKMALKIKNDSSEVYYNLGNAYLHKGSFNEAVAAFQKSLEFNPNDADARNNLENINKLMKKEG